MPAFWVESLSTLIHIAGHETRQQRRNPPRAARLAAAASCTHLNDLHRSRDDLVCRSAARVFAWGGRTIEWVYLLIFKRASVEVQRRG